MEIGLGITSKTNNKGRSFGPNLFNEAQVFKQNKVYLNMENKFNPTAYEFGVNMLKSQN